MRSLGQFLQRWLNLLATLGRIVFSAAGKKLPSWKLKTQLFLRDCLENPAENIEALLYSEMRFIAAIYGVPFQMNLHCREANLAEWKPRVALREGFPLFCATGTQALLMIRVFFCLPISYRFSFMREGMLTPDALLFLTEFFLLVGAEAAAIMIFLQRKEMAQMFNSCTVFSESYARKRDLFS